MRPEDERPDFDRDRPPGWFLVLLILGGFAAAWLIAMALARWS